MVDALLQMGNTLAYGSIAWYMVRYSLGYGNYAHLCIGLHFAVVVLRLVTIMIWGDAPSGWTQIHRLTALICALAIAYEYWAEQRAAGEIYGE